jgi:hypothetical protein
MCVGLSSVFPSAGLARLWFGGESAGVMRSEPREKAEEWEASELFLACSGLVKEVGWVKYSSAEGRRPSWDGPWDDWGRERGEEVEDMDAERECRD